MFTKSSPELPVFPLHSVLFPGGVLALKIFELRYMEMAKTCIRDNQPFGVCLIEKGEEVGTAVPHLTGVTARIDTWDMEQLGVLQVAVRGEQRFRILDQATDRQGLIVAKIEIPDAEPAVDIPQRLQPLLTLLRAIALDIGHERILEPHAFNDATWVGYRYAEMLPISSLARQKLLELDDSISRLEIIDKFLRQRGLLK